MFSKLGKLYNGMERTYRGIIMIVVIVIMVGVGYAGYVVYQKGSGMFNFFSGLVKDSYGRGAGIPLVCGPNEEQNGALCYPKCRAGYDGVGPVCWQTCPAGFRNDGAYCAKPEPYGRGAGYVLWDEEKCKRENGQCEKEGALWYPKCKVGFHNVGCCICSPNCPADMTDIGVSCQKNSYGRTAGTPLHACPDGHEKDGALCYPQCKPGYKGVGPVCWEKS